jgi:AcrR family transcriptional regulator
MPGTKSKVSPLPTRKRQRQDTRNLILEVALAEIAEVGLNQVRIEHIAKKAGVTRPTIYTHFPTKEDFLRELEARSQESALLVLQTRLGEASGAALAHRLADAVFDLLDAADPRLRREVFSLLLREPEKADWSGNPLFGFLSARFKEAQTLWIHRRRGRACEDPAQSRASNAQPLGRADERLTPARPYSDRASSISSSCLARSGEPVPRAKT